MSVGTVTATSLNIRQTPAPDGVIVGFLRQGAGVTITGASPDGSWLQISAVVDGVTKLGWVAGKFIDQSAGGAGQGAQVAVPAPVIPPADDADHRVTVIDPRAYGPGNVSFAHKFRLGFVTSGITAFSSWLAGRQGADSPSASIIRAVSLNEGRFEAINSWDSNYMSFGMFQWTAGGANAPGELAALLHRLEQSSPDAFQEYFGRYGIRVEVRDEASTTGELTLNGARLVSDGDKNQLRQVEWAYRFWRAGHDDAVRACQFAHATSRIAIVQAIRVAGLTIKDWVSSQYGVALLLDEHVNRPGHVAPQAGEVSTLEKALNALYPGGLPASTVGWGDAEESALLRAYIDAREPTSMTDSTGRAIRIGSCVHAGWLSDKRGSA